MTPEEEPENPICDHSTRRNLPHWRAEGCIYSFVAQRNQRHERPSGQPEAWKDRNLLAGRVLRSYRSKRRTISVLTKRQKVFAPFLFANLVLISLLLPAGRRRSQDFLPLRQYLLRYIAGNPVRAGLHPGEYSLYTQAFLPVKANFKFVSTDRNVCVTLTRRT